MTLNEKLEKANNNISILIDEIVSLKQENRMYCCHPQEKFDNKNFCENDCDNCKEKYYEEMRERLNNKYQVNEK